MITKSDKILRSSLIIVDAAVRAVSNSFPQSDNKNTLEIAWEEVQTYINENLRVGKDTIINR